MLSNPVEADLGRTERSNQLRHFTVVQANNQLGMLFIRAGQPNAFSCLDHCCRCCKIIDSDAQ
ncbi:hypothetical protein D3C81_2327210 [compost metagenome]